MYVVCETCEDFGERNKSITLPSFFEMVLLTNFSVHLRCGHANGELDTHLTSPWVNHPIWTPPQRHVSGICCLSVHVCTSLVLTGALPITVHPGLQSVLGLEVDWETYEEDLLPSGSGLRVPWREFIPSPATLPPHLGSGPSHKISWGQKAIIETLQNVAKHVYFFLLLIF